MRVLRKSLVYTTAFICLAMLSGCICELFPFLCRPDPLISPQLAIFPTSLDFEADEHPKTFNITNVRKGTLNWNAASNRAWIAVTPTNGTTTAETDSVSVTVNRDTLSYGVHTGEVQVSSNGGMLKVSISARKDPGGTPFVQAREGNNCTQNNCGGAPYVKGKKYNFKKTSKFENDEARSFQLYWLPVGAKIKVYDNPDGKTDDDWTEITIKKVVAQYCLGTLENTYEDDTVRVSYHRNNGLDGKVSHLKMD